MYGFSNNPYFTRFRKYNEDGILVADMEANNSTGTVYFPVYYDTTINKSNVVMGEWNRSMAQNMAQPGYINTINEGSYLGYRYYGTYATPEGVSMTGYVWPMVESMGNGSVVYVEEINGENPYFAVYFNGKIDKRYTYIADALVPIEFVMKLDSLTQSKLDITAYSKGTSTTTQPLLTLNMKDSTNYTGYGIDYESEFNGGLLAAGNMRIGFFKDGKLNGLGYRAHISEDFNSRSSSTYQVISYEYGFFENDILVRGESGKGKGLAEHDCWVKPTNPLFHFYSRKSLGDNYTFQVASKEYKTLTPNESKIYVKSVNRMFDLVKVDPIAKKLIVQGTEAEGLIAIDQNDEPYLVVQETSSTISEDCFRCEATEIVTQQGYYTEYVPAGFVQEGIYYTYYVSYKKAVKRKYNYDAVCPKCKGTGVFTYGNSDMRYSLNPLSF